MARIEVFDGDAATIHGLAIASTRSTQVPSACRRGGGRRSELEVRPSADRRDAAACKKSAATGAARLPSTPHQSDVCSLSSADSPEMRGVSDFLAFAPWRKGGTAPRRSRCATGSASVGSTSDDDSTHGPASSSSCASWPVRSPAASSDGSSSEGEFGECEVSSRCSVDEEAEDERILRTVRSILNKLTVEKFDALYEQLATCGITQARHLQSAVHEVFEKATAQHHFIPMYADLCVRLESEDRIVIADGRECAKTNRSDQFRHLLLNRCQGAFEELLAPSSCASEEDDEARFVRKQRALGNVKFVGHLLVRGMLSPRLTVQCAEDLLEARLQCGGALEFLAAFLTVAAPAFDTPRFAQHTQLQAVLQRCEELARDKVSVSSRERCLLRDLVDLRAAGWAGRQLAAKPSAPMRLEEVREGAAVVGPTTPSSRSCSSPSWASPISKSLPWSPSWKAAPQQQRQQQDRVANSRRPAVGAKHDAGPASGPQSPKGYASPQAGINAATSAATPPAPAPAPAVAKAQSLPDAAAKPSGPFDPKAFRRVVSEAMKQLASAASVPAVVGRIREQGVPVARQAAEFADILTRASEESRGPNRRTAFAFAAGLAAADGTSAFDRSACLEGIGIFFSDVYPDLCEEVPRLPSLIRGELVPTLRSVLPEASLRRAVPVDLWP